MINQGHLVRLISKEYRWLQHPLFWLVICFPRILDLMYAHSLEQMVVYGFLLVTNIFLVYFNILFLVPQLFLRGRVMQYLIATAVSIVGMAMFNATYYETVFTKTGQLDLAPGARIAEYAVFSASVLGAALAFHILRVFLENKAQLRLAQSAQLETEVNFLKSQVNPHFLFNALNNVQVQLKLNPAEASQSIGHLSALLRYQLYDSAKEKVFLRDEVEYLQNFLRLHNMRTGGAPIEMQIAGDMEGIKVTPYLFIPFVENAVKHSRGLGGPTLVRVGIKVDSQEVHFYIENSKPKVANKKEKSGGIGVINISRRLDLLYPNRYYLEIWNGAAAYAVKMRLRY